MSGKAMMAKGRKITTVGFSRNLCGPDRCVCMEDPPGSQETYRRMLATTAGCDMFAIPSQHIAHGSLGGSHLNEYLKAVNARRPTSETALHVPMGDKVIDKDRLFASDPQLKEACESGLRRTVISHAIG